VRTDTRPCPRRRIAVPGRAVRTRRFGVAAAVSAALHVTVLGAALLAARHHIHVLPAPDKKAEVELLMVEQKGAGETSAPPAAPPTRDVQESQKRHAAPPPPSPVGNAQAAVPPPAPPPDPDATETVPATPTPPDRPPAAARPAIAAAPPEPPTPPAPAASESHAAAAAPPAPSAITFNLGGNLGGTDSESNALASGDGVIPASPDNRHRNRPPPYPDSAALRGEHGAVTLLIHISPLGVAAGADVMESSGHASLDDAALQAVRSWRFVPAVKDGQPVPFDMPMRFVFSLN
jgi:protein TonB